MGKDEEKGGGGGREGGGEEAGVGKKELCFLNERWLV